MALIDDISKTLADIGTEAAQKAKGVAEIVQLKAQASSEKSKVKTLYGAIGQLYYKKHKDDADGEYQSIVDEITSSLVRISQLQDKIHRLDGSVVCENCGAVIRKGNAFCGKCGAPAPKAAEPEADEEAEAADEAEAEVSDGAEAVCGTDASDEAETSEVAEASSETETAEGADASDETGAEDKAEI